MKIKLGSYFSPRKKRKILLIMKLSTILMVVFTLNISAIGFGQFSFKAEGKTVREIFDIIEQGSNYRFFYNDEFESASKIIDLEVRNKDINQVLDKILENTDYTYKVFENNLIVISLKKNIREQSDLQQKIVRGVVTDDKGVPIPGATIVVKGTSRGITTDLNGNYVIENVPPQSILVVSFVGFESQEITVGDKAEVNIALKQVTTSLDEVVVIGYGTIKKRDLTGSVASISGDMIRDVPSANISQALQGRIPGVELSQTSTKPGASMQIRIRGSRSLNAINDPLLVIDGIPFAGSISDIDPDVIKSIDILKDASATAIYGSRGANGVILITTNKGQIGQKATVTYNTYTGLKKVFSRYPMMNGPEFVELRKASAMYTNTLDEADTINTDWQDLLYKTGMVTSHDLGVSGGTEKGNYNFGVGYYKDDAVVPMQDYTRYSMRSSLDQEVGKSFRFGFTTNTNYSVSNGSNLGAVSQACSLSPIANIYLNDSTLKERFLQATSGLAWVSTRKTLEALGDKYIDQAKAFGTYNTLYGELKIPGIKGLKYRINVGLNYRQSNSGSYTGVGVFSGTPTNNSVGSINNSQTINWVIENLLTYDRTFAGKHQVNFVGMYSADQTTFNSSYVSAKDIPVDALQYYNLGRAVGEIKVDPNYQSYNQSGLISWMGRLIYSFDNRYILTATIRSDASSRLAEGHKWHTYPAVSVGWNIKNESFMNSIPQIDLLKLRVGYGQTSNQAINPYATLGQLTSRPYNFGGTYSMGYFVSSLPNYNLGWEYSLTWNFGLDFAVLKNRLYGTVEYYITDTKDILLNLNLPPTSGVSSFMANIGETQNKGLELTLGGVILKNYKGFTWDANFNLYANRNKLVALASGQTRDESNWWFVGYPIDVIYDYENIGLWQASDPYRNILEPGGNVGMIKVKYTGDYNPDGSPTRAITAADRQIINVEPDFQGGFSTRVAYKGVDLSIVGTYKKGGIINSTIYGSGGYLNNLNTRSGNNVQIDYWMPTDTIAWGPKPNGVGGDNPKYGSTLGYFDASYLKIRTISLGYNFENFDLIKRVGVSHLRLYVTVQNPFVLFSPYNKESGMDPETNSYGNENAAVPLSGSLRRLLTVGTNTPATRNYLIGLSLTF
jgi:TonB-dependent starch-binding outer membrane protein SusC